MSALDEYLNDEKYEPELYDADGWKLLDQARAELAQLRADLQAAQERIAWLTSDIGEDGLAAINRLIAACNLMDIPQQYTPDLSIARDEILRQARQLAEAREILSVLCDDAQNRTGKERYTAWDRADDWLAANPAPEPQP